MILNDAPVIFHDSFDVKNPGIPSRTGDLDPNVWGVSRATGNVNFGSHQFNNWASTLIKKCDGTTPRVSSPNDVIICNGQLRQASNDNISGDFEAGTVTVLAMYPKQPFDFASRTGTVSFDVSNDTHGSHAAWPEFWLSDLPVPTPFAFQGWTAVPKHGLGIRFHAAAGPGNPGSFYQGGDDLSKWRWTVGSAIVIRDYIHDDTEGYGTRTNMQVHQLGSVLASPGPGGPLNHIELRISQDQIDVYATDAGVAPSAATLKHIASITDADLSFTRGLVWLQDVHYNADKGDIDNPSQSQREHTFVWDNLEFDGPFTYRDFSYDALDNNEPMDNGSVNLGKLSLPGQTSSWNVLNMPASPQAAAVRVLFNLYHYDHPTSLNVIVNGHSHAVAWPYPDTNGYHWRTFGYTIPIADLVTGTNVVQIGGADQALVVSNVNIVLVNVPGGVPVLPGSNNAYPDGSTPPVDPPPVDPPTDVVTVTIGHVPVFTVPKGQAITVSVPVTVSH